MWGKNTSKYIMKLHKNKTDTHFFLNQESIVLKDAMGTLRPSHYRADE